jgi:hypothetical protein
MITSNVIEVLASPTSLQRPYHQLPEVSPHAYLRQGSLADDKLVLGSITELHGVQVPFFPIFALKSSSTRAYGPDARLQNQ